jgi:tetratricopeptide (TPR) repeat protein
MKTKLILAFVCAALLLTAHAHAQTLDDANRAFAEGHYHASTLGYQSVLDQKGYSAPVLFDLGNSYFREAAFADAILAYKRAQWLSPNNPDISANLRLAQKQAGLPILEPRWSDQLSGLMCATDWSWLGSGAMTLLCLSLLARAALPAQRIPFSCACVASVLVLSAALTAMAFSAEELPQAVVIDKNASALISPFLTAQAAFTPVPGEVVTTGKTYNDFVLVKNAAGYTGWVSKMQIARIIPPVSAGKTL